MIALRKNRFVDSSTGRLFTPISDWTWNLSQLGLSSSDVKLYARTRAKQGFTVIGLGLSASFFRRGTCTLDKARWKGPRNVIDRIVGAGLRVCPCLEMSNYRVVQTCDDPQMVVPERYAREYGRIMAGLLQRWGDRVMGVLCGSHDSRTFSGQSAASFLEIERGVHEEWPELLISTHCRPRKVSLEYKGRSDFVSSQARHAHDRDTAGLIADLCKRGQASKRPFWGLEPAYEAQHSTLALTRAELVDLVRLYRKAGYGGRRGVRTLTVTPAAVADQARLYRKAGAAGIGYGRLGVWGFESGWKRLLDSAGAEAAVAEGRKIR